MCAILAQGLSGKIVCIYIYVFSLGNVVGQDFDIILRMICGSRAEICGDCRFPPPCKMTQDLSKGGAVETGCSDVYAVIY